MDAEFDEYRVSRKNRKRRRQLQEQQDELLLSIEERYIRKQQKKKLKRNKQLDNEKHDQHVDTAIQAEKIQRAGEQLRGQKRKKKKKRQKDGNPVRVLKMGIQAVDLLAGDGQTVCKGNTTTAKYVGRLSNPHGKIFDQGTISFRVGRGEVIKGFDIGVLGMRLGSKRRLIIPPKAGYGKFKQGRIPGNSVLCFDISILSISK